MDPICTYPLTRAQKKIWNIEKLFPYTPVHNIGGFIQMTGNIDYNALHKAISECFKINDSLRLRFVETDNGVRQYLHKSDDDLSLPFVDFSKYRNPEFEFEQWMQHEFTQPFDLLKDHPFARFWLIKLDEQRGGYVIKIHHIVADGWSIQLITDQISHLYEANSEEQTELDFGSYLDYIEKEKEYLQSKRYEKDKLFWSEKLGKNFAWSNDKQFGVHAGKRRSVVWDELKSERVRDFCRKHRCSINSFFVGLLAVYWSKRTRSERITISNPVFNRRDKKDRRATGMFTSTVFLNISLPPGTTFSQLINNITKETMNCFKHQRFPLDQMISELFNRNGRRGNPFELCVNYYNTKLATQIGDLRMENKEWYSGYQLYSLQVVIADWLESGALELRLDYKTCDYSDNQIERLIAHLENILDYVLDDPECAIDDIVYTTDAEKHMLDKFNNRYYDIPITKIHRLFEKQAHHSIGEYVAAGVSGSGPARMPSNTGNSKRNTRKP